MSVRGLDDFISVVNVVSNPDKYTEKVNELKGLIANYTEAIEAVVKLADVNEYTQNIRTREEQSKAELESAKKEAQDIKAKAREYSRSEKDKIAGIIQDLNARKVELDNQENAIKAKYKKFLDEKYAHEAKEKEVADREEALAKGHKDLADRIKKLSAAMQ